MLAEAVHKPEPVDRGMLVAAGALTVFASIIYAGIYLAAPAFADQETPALQGIDVYGTDTFDAAFLESEYGEALDRLADATNRGDFEVAEEIRNEMKRGLNELGDFALLEISLVRYYQPRSAYVTVDVVERDDAERRMPFREAPGKQGLDDPGGLIARWREYEESVLRILRSGSLVPGECEVFHCLASFRSNAELLPYLSVFNEGAMAHENALYEIVARDSDPQRRAAAVFLLAHTEDVERLLPALGEAMFDVSSHVRNNAIRVMAVMAEADPERPFPVRDLVVAMDFPLATDRNKATYTVASLAGSRRHRAIILETAVPVALRLLRLKQPNNHNAAYDLLTTLSGEEFGERDYRAWEEWHRGVRAL